MRTSSVRFRAGPILSLDSSLKMTLLLRGDCCSCSDNIAANICGNIFLHLTTLKTFRKIRSWCSSLSYKHLLEVKSNVWFCLNYIVFILLCRILRPCWFTPSRQRWWAVTVTDEAEQERAPANTSRTTIGIMKSNCSINSLINWQHIIYLITPLLYYLCEFNHG